MPTPSAVSRYRPAVLVLTGAAAAYAAWLIYDTFSAPAHGLHRSNAIRREHNRARSRNLAPSSARIVEQLLAETTPLGEFDFFGHTITLDNTNIMTHDALMDLGHELQPDASDAIIESRIDQLYDLLADRLLGAMSQGRSLSDIPHPELVAILTIMDEIPGEHRLAIRSLFISFAAYDAYLRNTNNVQGNGLGEVFDRLRSRTEILDAHGQPVDHLESIPPTEAGDWEEGIAGDVEGQTLQRTLYHIAEDRARHEGVVHRGITCNGCDNRPIRGIRWHCANCADFDLCSDCEATNSHTKTHIFYKIRVPAPNLSISKQEPLYPGRPHLMSPSVDAKLKRRLVNDTRMEAEEIEALWDQFTCLATSSWTADPNGLGWALDRRAFNHAFIPRYSSFKSAPNLIYDRVFSYFDTDHNTLIGFEEFVKGIDGLHTTDTHVKLRIVFNGYDVDGDGYISRKDVLRIFRAHYAIEREATKNYLAETAEEMSVRGALEVIHSAQPLGSAFVQGAIEPGGPNWMLGSKAPDDEVSDAPVVENRSDTLDRATIIASTHPHRHDEDGRRAVEDTLQDRWSRRQFYTDEEEGFTRPEGADDGPAPSLYERSDEYHEEQSDENEGNEATTPDRERPRWSRSSSRVRFQDDIDVETRSNASISSRPVGERWGGYEIPEPEKDLGREVLYQITQQAFNELLDPLFKRGEDDSLDAYSTRDWRRQHVEDVDTILDKFDNKRDILTRMVSVGVFTYVNCVVNAFCFQDFTRFKNLARHGPDMVYTLAGSLLEAAEHEFLLLTDPPEEEPYEMQLWTMMLYRRQLCHELEDAMAVLADRQGWTPEEPSKIPEANDELDEPVVDRDPTFPQFRPNSESDTSNTGSNGTQKDEHSSQRKDFGPLFVVAKPLDASPPTSLDSRPATEVGTSPYTLDEHGITLSRPIPLTVPVPHPMMHLLSFDGVQLLDETRLLSQHPAFNPHAMQQRSTFDQAITTAAYDTENKTADIHLKVVALARLESVDRRDSERKGAGKVDFSEFERAAREGRMKFLESWMDWVSF